MRQAAKNGFYALTRPIEGHLPFMYLDRKGYVTTGDGNLIDPVGSALGLPWVNASGAPASEDEIYDAWNTVKARQDMRDGGGKAYGKLTSLRLDDATIAALVDRKLASDEATLTRYFPAMSTWPADAQLAVVSMAWALGPAFAEKYPKFVRAITQLRPDFATAALESGISEEGNEGVHPRNVLDRELLENAEMAMRQGLDFDVLQTYIEGAESPPPRPRASPVPQTSGTSGTGGQSKSGSSSFVGLATFFGLGLAAWVGYKLLAKDEHAPHHEPSHEDTHEETDGHPDAKHHLDANIAAYHAK